MGLALHYLGKYDMVMACYDKILEKSPDNAGVLYHKACTKSLQGDIEQALTFLEKAIILESEYAGKDSQDRVLIHSEKMQDFKS